MDNGEVVDTYEDVILNNNLLGDREINLTKYGKITKDNEIQKNYNDCLKYIKLRLRSEKEIEEFLRKKGVENEQIREVISKLKKNSLINDEYFCKCFIHDKMKFSTQGEYKIINELKRVGISDEIIDKNYYLFDRGLLQGKINKLIDRYLKSNKNKSGVVLKNKIYTNLMNQGYSKEMILESLSKYNF